jgi:ABC-type sugar transport system ATPase subunit
MLELDSVTKRYDGQLALDDVSVSLARGSVVGIAGENRAGKSTLLNIGSGIVQADTGTMRLDGREIRPGTYKEANELGVWRVFQEPALIGGIPPYDNIFLGNESAFTRLGIVRHARMVREAQRIVDEFGIGADVRRQAGKFPYSVRQAIEAVKATAAPDALGLPCAFVLFDEATAALSQEEVPRLLDMIKKLASRGLGVAFVSHRLQEVLSLCDDIVVLKDGAVVSEAKAQSVDEASLHQLMVGRERHQDFHAEDRQGGAQSERIVLSVRGAGRRDRARAPVLAACSSRSAACSTAAPLVESLMHRSVAARPRSGPRESSAGGTLRRLTRNSPNPLT